MPSPRILIKCDPAEREDWQAALRTQLPEAELLFWPECGAVSAIDYALLWQPDQHLLEHLAGVRVIFSLGAGVDHLLRHATLPAGVPIVRLVDPMLTEGMTHYLLYQVLRIHRRMDVYEQQQGLGIWRQHRQRRAQDTRVGVLGYGELGRHAGEHLQALGFNVRAWARTGRNEGTVVCSSGEPALFELLASSDIVIVLLPLTAATRGLLDARVLGTMRSSAWLINVGRGALLDEAALLRMLDGGRLAGACLDVFAHEPLPPEHPFWRHPRVSVTPHIASLTTAASAAAIISAQIRRHASGAELHHRVDSARGY